MSSFTFDFTGLESALHKAYPEFFGRLSKKASDFTRNYGVMSMFLGSLRRVVDKYYWENCKIKYHSREMLESKCNGGPDFSYEKDNY